VVLSPFRPASAPTFAGAPPAIIPYSQMVKQAFKSFASVARYATNLTRAVHAWRMMRAGILASSNEPVVVRKRKHGALRGAMSCLETTHGPPILCRLNRIYTNLAARRNVSVVIFVRMLTAMNDLTEDKDRGYRVFLPAPGNVRWTASRKRAVLLALDLRVISEEEVCPMHPDELSA
jgi:hypothetical protein